MRKPMSRTESQMILGLSMEEATKALIYYDQGLRWIKNIDYQDKLQDEMDKFVEYLVQQPKQNVNKFVAFVKDKYFAKDGEEVDDQEFNRRWHQAYRLLSVQ